MRKIYVIIFFGLLGVSFWWAKNWENSSKPIANKSVLLGEEPAAIGTKDDPKARDNYEWLRLRDPLTGQIPAQIKERELEFAKKLPTQEALMAKLGKASEAAAPQVASWSARGPANVGGRTRALAVDIANVNNILAGGVSGGMWRSTNGGASWTKTTTASALHSVSCVAQDKRTGKTGIWYYGTGEYRGNSAGGGSASYRGDGIFKSTNGGVTWMQLPSTVSGTPQSFDQMFDYVWNVATDPSNPTQDEVYAATYAGIMRSTNGGTAWTPVLGSIANTSGYTDVAITNAGVVYATLSSDGTIEGIYRSTNGTTWTNITPAGWPSVYYRIVIGIAPSNSNVVYFLAETPVSGLNGHSLWKYTYLSGDGSGAGGAWVNRSANLPAYGGLTGNFDSQGSYDLVIKVKPDNENVVFIGGTNLYRSTDGFASTANTKWIGGYNSSNVDYSRYPNHHPDQHALAFSTASATTLLSGHDGGVSKTTDNLAATVVWTSLSGGYVTSQFYTVAIDHATSGNNIIIGGLQDNGSWFTNTTLSSTPWIELLGGDGSYCAIANSRTSYYGSFQNGVVFRLLVNNAGSYTQWTRVDPTRPGGSAAYLFINPFVLDPTNSNMMYLAGGDRIWRNSDLTAIPLFSQNTTSVNWTALTNTAVSGSVVTALAVSKTPANRLYYGTHNGQVYRVNNANVGSPARTDVWTGKGFPANAYVSCIAVDPANADRALVVFSNYSIVSLFYTSNGGTSWTPVAGNLEQNANGFGNGPSCRWAAILPTSGATAYLVGTSTGLYSTTNLNGASTVWAMEGATAIGNVVVDMIATRQADRLAVVGTHGRGVFSAQIPATAQMLPPRTLSATLFDKYVILNWQAPTAGFDSSLVAYNIYRATGQVQILVQNKIGTVKAPFTTFSDSTASGGTVHYYKVTAVYKQGESGASNQIEVRTPVNACHPHWYVNLTVRDAGAGRANLSFGQSASATNGLDRACEADLPPPPPSGIFDARFELPVHATHSLNDFRGDSARTAIWRLKFQPGVAGPMTFAWNRAGFPAGSFFLKDEINGALVNVNMKIDSTYTLTNNALTSLRIGPAANICREISVNKDWNIVSVPLAAADMGATTLFPGAVSSVFGYNNGYAAASALQNGVGYWIKFDAAKIYQICGSPALKAIPVNAGWNLIGPFDFNVPVASITSVPGGIIASGYFGYNNGFSNATILNVGKGYWVKASQAGVLNINTVGKPAAIAANSANSAWPQILFEDANGRSETLYLAPASENNGHFELPPTPPQGIFDVRFSSGRSVESLEEGRHEIQLSSAQYPIRITAKNFAAQELRVRDLLSGNIVNERLAAGRAVTIAAALDRLALTTTALPARYALSQNAPNPFNPATVIKFSLPEKAHVKISVYNIKGEKVAEPVNGEKPAGYHQLQFDARSFASGTYFYVMESGAFRDLKKMMIVK